MTLRILLPLALMLLAPARAFADDDDFHAWARRPKEPFTDSERALRETKKKLLAEYADDQLSEDDLNRAAIAGMLAGAGGRKWDKLLAPSELAELKSEMAGEVVGIGVEIKFESDGGLTTVLGNIPGSPAEKAGLRAGDKILKIDGKSYRGQQFRDVVYAIRGAPGKPVSLTLLRDDAIITKSVVREKIAWSPVEELTLPGAVTVIHIAAFTEKTPALLRAILERARKANTRALVLDLRGNEGGLFEPMLTCAGLFLPKDSLITTAVGRGGKQSPHRTTSDPLLPIATVPTIVLTNDHTASGAEILAGALKAGGARIAGKRTHGKWNVQSISDLPNHWAIKYTIAVLKTPRGDSPDGKGLDPDLEVELDSALAEKSQRIRDPQQRLAADAQLRAALALLK